MSAEAIDNRLAKFEKMLEELRNNAPDDETLSRNIDVLLEQVHKKGVDQFHHVAQSIFGKNGADLIKALAEAQGEISLNEIKSRTNILKKIWKRTVGKVWRDTVEEVKSGNPYMVVGSILSVTGKTWSALSEFWDEAQDEIPALKFADKPIKAAAIALYIKGAPVLGVIKAAEFVGRTSIEYGKTRKFFHSLWVAAKDTLSSIYHHFLRLTIGTKFSPALEQFAKTLGSEFRADKARAKEFAEFIKSQDVTKYLQDLTPEQAETAAKKIFILSQKMSKEKEVVDIGAISNIVIPSVAKGLSDERIRGLVEASQKSENKLMLEKLPTTIRSMAMYRIAEASLQQKDRSVENIMSDSLRAVSKLKEKELKLDDFEEYLKEHKSGLHKKLEPYFKHSNIPEKFTINQVSELFEGEDNLKKMKKADKKEFMILAADFATEKALYKAIGEDSKRTKSWADINPSKSKSKFVVHEKKQRTHEEIYEESKTQSKTESRGRQPK